MDFNEIKRLVKLVESSGIDEIEIQEDAFLIRVTKSKGSAHAPMPIHVQTPVPQPQITPADKMQSDRVEAETAETGKNIIEIKAPMVGTYYNSPTPGAEVFVNEGDTVSPGKVLCIIEAMKLMNEIECEISGKIVKILVDDGQAVEYNQTLFHIEKLQG